MKNENEKLDWNPAGVEISPETNKSQCLSARQPQGEQGYGK
jgi:hypothetical protein